MKRKNIICIFLSMFILTTSMVSCDKEISKLTNSSGVNVTGHFAKGSKLVVEKIKEATKEQKTKIYENGLCVDYDLHVYDISIQKDNVKIEPNGKTKVTIDFPNSSSNGHRVFHFKNNGDMEVLEPTIKNKKLSFETNSFSIFIIGENKPDIYSYDITYNLNGGSFDSAANIINKYSNESDFPLTLPIPTKENYSFKGWENPYGIVIKEIDNKMRGNLTLTAKWDEALYTISKDEKTITFGSYPQNLMDDENLILSLNAFIHNMPERDNGKEWTSFGFYSKNIKSDYAWYKDVDYEGNKYRAVCFNSWRLRYTKLESVPYNWQGSTDGYQMKNGVELNKVYWFKFAPLQWRVLTKDSQKALLMCDKAIDSMQYQHDLESEAPCDYAKSDIRAWLNSSFYDLAFGTKQKELISTTLIDNSKRSADAKEDEYSWNIGTDGKASKNTEDKVFLLSSYELTNKEYGFVSKPTMLKVSDPLKRIWWSEYSKCIGGEVINNSSSFYPNCSWWTRSPYYVKTKSAAYTNALTITVDQEFKNMDVSRVTQGVVPALWLKF